MASDVPKRLLEFSKRQPKRVEEVFGPENMFAVKGVPFQEVLVSKESVEKTLEFKSRDNDIFICSYPKSGTTWLQFLVWAVMNMDDVTKSLPSLMEMKSNLQRFIDFNGIEGIEKFKILVTHLPYDVCPLNPKAKYLYVIRDPKDAATSLFFMMKQVYGFQNEEIQLFYDYFIKGWLVYGDYFQNVTSWYDHKDDQNVLILFYEDMLENPEKEIMRIADFLSDDQNDYSAILKTKSGLLQKIVNDTSFQNMNPGKPSAAPGFHSLFFRKGIRGDYAAYMRPDQIKTIDELIRERLGEPFVSKYVE